MSLTKKISKNVLDEQGNFAKDEQGKYIMEEVEVEYTPEELAGLEIEKLKFEEKTIISYLEKTRWVYDKQKDLGLTDYELENKHGDVLTERKLKREQLQTIQELLKA